MKRGEGGYSSKVCDLGDNDETVAGTRAQCEWHLSVSFFNGSRVTIQPQRRYFRANTLDQRFSSPTIHTPFLFQQYQTLHLTPESTPDCCYQDARTRQEPNAIHCATTRSTGKTYKKTSSEVVTIACGVSMLDSSRGNHCQLQVNYTAKPVIFGACLALQFKQLCGFVPDESS